MTITDKQVEPAWCPACKGSGEGVGIARSGLDTFEVPIQCDRCEGIGAAHSSAEQPAKADFVGDYPQPGYTGLPKLTTVYSDERARFEVWAFAELRTPTSEWGAAWSAWQAARSQSAPAAQGEVVPGVAPDRIYLGTGCDEPECAGTCYFERGAETTWCRDRLGPYDVEYVRADLATPQPSAPGGLHPRTADLVLRFSAALAAKLFAAQQKYGYSDGWADSDWLDECRAKLLEHVDKGDPRDVANYCAFLWHHGASTAQPSGRPSTWPGKFGDALFHLDRIAQAAGVGQSEWTTPDQAADLIIAKLSADGAQPSADDAPVDMLLFCPRCSMQHIDAPEPSYADNGEDDTTWHNPPHRSHLCHGCGHIWRPADVATNGVAKLRTQGKEDGSPIPAPPADARDAGAVRHGVNCQKVIHSGSGYLHGSEDDTPYDVDGVSYCGRCHYAIERRGKS